MNRTLKISLGAAVLLLLAASVSYYLYKSRGNTQSASSSDKITSLYNYDVKIDSQRIQNDQASLILKFDGQLALQSLENDSYISQWTTIKNLETAEGVASPGGLLDKPMISEPVLLGFDHRANEEFPEEYAVFSQSVLDHLLVMPKREQGAIFKREKQDVSIFNVDYRIARESDQIHIARKWVQTITGGVRIDPTRNTLTYTFDSNYDLLAMEGQVAFHVTEPQGNVVTVVTNYQVTRAQPAATKITVDRKTFSRELGITRVEPKSDTNNDAEPKKTFAESLAAVDEMNQNTLPADYSKAYLSLIDNLRKDPAGLQKIKDKLLTLDFKDVEGASQAAFLYSVIAGHDTKETSDMLSTLFVKDCPSVECKEGAIHSYNYLTKMSPESANNLLDLATSGAPTDRVSSQAWLGVGIAGRNLGEGFPELKPAIERAYAQTDDGEKASERVTILDSIGNFGDRSMLPLIDKAVLSKDDDVRMTALAALRFVPGEDVDEALLSALEKNEEPHDKGESLRSLALREINLEALTRIAKTIPSYNDKNQDLAVNSASIILDSYERNPELTKSLVEDLSQNLKNEELKSLFKEALNPSLETEGNDSAE